MKKQPYRYDIDETAKRTVKSVTYTGTTNSTGLLFGGVTVFGMPNGSVPLRATLAQDNYNTYRRVIIGDYGGAGVYFRCLDTTADSPIASQNVTLTIYYV